MKHPLSTKHNSFSEIKVSLGFFLASHNTEYARDSQLVSYVSEAQLQQPMFCYRYVNKYRHTQTHIYVYILALGKKKSQLHTIHTTRF